MPALESLNETALRQELLELAQQLESCKALEMAIGIFNGLLLSGFLIWGILAAWTANSFFVWQTFPAFLVCWALARHQSLHSGLFAHVDRLYQSAWRRKNEVERLLAGGIPLPGYPGCWMVPSEAKR